MALLFDSWLAELAIVLFTIFASFYKFCEFRFQHWKKKGIPYLEPTFPFGNIAQMALIRKPVGEVFNEIYQNTGAHKMAGYYQLWTPILMIKHPELVKTILVKDFTNFHDHGFHFDEENDPLAAHLFSMEGTKWRHLRYKLIPTFTSGKMKMMFPTLVECGKEMQQYLVPLASRNDSLEVKDVLARYSTDVIATCAFGIQSNSLKNPDSEFRTMGRKIFNPPLMQTAKAMLSFLIPPLGKLFKIRTVERNLSDFFIGVVRETVEYRETNNVSRNDFMQLLLRIKNKKSIVDDESTHTESSPHNADSEKTSEENYYDVNGMTVEQMAAQAYVFFIAGFESSSTTMSFTLYELALNQDIQSRLRDEIDSVLADHDGEMTYEAVLEMKYLDNVVSETLRKYPPIPLLMRVCTKEYKMPDTDIILEKGTSLIIPVLSLHRDPQHYPDPEKYDPDRFTEEAKSQRHHFAYLPFGEGPRICIGSRFALMQIKVGLASLVSKYQFNICKQSTAIPLVLDPKSFVMSAKGGINLQITERN